ncbi:MAG TPA: hypothetical protein VE986_00980 [Hyphomicrobiales bacterium]|nr:hypothetical protein [Hyphomicrobiales bacterium]
MKNYTDQTYPKSSEKIVLLRQALRGLLRHLLFPLRFLGKAAIHIAQALLALFVVVLHPQIKWLAGLIVNSAAVQQYAKPAFQVIFKRIYEPYFAFLKRLPPYWATLSIAMPLAILEPAKLYATILIAEHPKTGIALWFAFQGLSFILIDKTWAAVRPRAREIWLVSRIHAWIWLNVAYGKYWLVHSAFFRQFQKLKQRLSRRLRAFLRRNGFQRQFVKL